jgi:hypothetical protein
MRRTLTVAVAGALALAACGGGNDKAAPATTTEKATTTTEFDWDQVTTTIQLGDQVTHMGEPVDVERGPIDDSLTSEGTQAELVAANPHAVGRGTGIDVTVTLTAESDGPWYPQGFDLVTAEDDVIATTDEWGMADTDSPMTAIVQPGGSEMNTVTFDIPLADTEGGALRLLALSRTGETFLPIASWRLG